MPLNLAGFGTFVIAATLATGHPTLTAPAQAASLETVVSAYIYGYPMLTMDETRTQFICGPEADVNTLAHVYSPPTPAFTTIVRPNVDTLYSSAFLDLSDGPVLFELPPSDGRYVLAAVFDAWTNNFAGISTLTHGVDGGTFAIVEADWVGELPASTQRIDSPTPTAWLLIRTELRGADDVDAANGFQDAIELVPPGASTATDVACPPLDPPDTIAAMSAVEFFSRLSELINEQGALPGDEPMLEQLEEIGVGPLATSTVEELGPAVKLELQLGVDVARTLLDQITTPAGDSGWAPDPTDPVGEYSADDYLLRAAIAKLGFGANRNEFAVYQNTSNDVRREPLTGSEIYTITFDPGELPPVDGFWSITVYDAEGHLTENEIARYALGSNSELVADDDGSVVLTLAHAPPADGSSANWLPVPDGMFSLTLRMYGPQQDILDGDWVAPEPRLAPVSPPEEEEEDDDEEEDEADDDGSAEPPGFSCSTTDDPLGWPALATLLVFGALRRRQR